MLRHPESVGRGKRTPPGTARFLPWPRPLRLCLTRRADNHVTLDQALAHFRAIAAAVTVPVNGDFEGGFAIAPEGVAANVRAAASTGLAGLSIEDSTGDAANPLFELGLAVERVRAARDAIDQSGTGVAHRAPEGLQRAARSGGDGAAVGGLRGGRRDCLYAPAFGRRNRSLRPWVRWRLPVNLLGRPFITVEKARDRGEAHQCRGRCTRGVGGFLKAAREIAAEGPSRGWVGARRG
jgi:hypothetical protein